MQDISEFASALEKINKWTTTWGDLYKAGDSTAHVQIQTCFGIRIFFLAKFAIVDLRLKELPWTLANHTHPCFCLVPLA